MTSPRLNNRDIAQLLSRSASELDAQTAAKLQVARRAALERQQRVQQAPVWGWLGEHGPILSGSHGHKTLHWIMATLVAVTLLGTVLYWQHASERDHAEIDIAILTDDLPVDVYVD